LTNITRTLGSLSDAKAQLKEIKSELDRLIALKLTSKTVDKQLETEIREMVQKPAVSVLTNIKRSMEDGSVPDELKGIVNSLAGFERQLQKDSKDLIGDNSASTASMMVSA